MYASALAASVTDASSARSRHEIDGELFQLYRMLRAVPMHSAFGDDNHDAIRAQIIVLREQMTTDEAVDRYEDGQVYVLCAALDATQWLRGIGEPLSLGWQQMAAA